MRTYLEHYRHPPYVVLDDDHYSSKTKQTKKPYTRAMILVFFKNSNIYFIILRSEAFRQKSFFVFFLCVLRQLAPKKLPYCHLLFIVLTLHTYSSYQSSPRYKLK